MSSKRKTTTAPGDAVSVECKTDNYHEFGLRPELKPENVGESWPQVLGLKVEYLSVSNSGRHEINMALQLRGKRIARAIVLALIPFLVYIAVTHDYAIVRRVVDMLQHLK